VGSIGAAKDNGKVLWFGTQSDQAGLAPKLVVASQVYDWTGMLKDIISQHQKGVLGGVQYTLTLSNGGLKVSYNPSYSLAAAVKAAGDAAIKGIAGGSISVQP
jgi:basic membrane protein A